MPNEMEIMAYIDRRVMIPAPGERFIYKYIHSDIISSMTAKPALSVVGQWADIQILTDSISVGVTSAVA